VACRSSATPSCTTHRRNLCARPRGPWSATGCAIVTRCGSVCTRVPTAAARCAAPVARAVLHVLSHSCNGGSSLSGRTTAMSRCSGHR
jgi:hypothetical protein